MDNPHKESVAVVNAQTPHGDFKHFSGSQFILSMLPVLARNKDSWVADHPVFILDNHLHRVAFSGPA